MYPQLAAIPIQLSPHASKTVGSSEKGIQIFIHPLSMLF
jgi:hypothetical protein